MPDFLGICGIFSCNGGAAGSPPSSIALLCVSPPSLFSQACSHCFRGLATNAVGVVGLWDWGGWRNPPLARRPGRWLSPPPALAPRHPCLKDFICPSILGAFFQEFGWSPRARLPFFSKPLHCKFENLAGISAPEKDI